MESAHQNCTAGWRFFLGFIGVLMVCGGIRGAEATVVVRMDLPELVKVSKWIVEGTVMGVKSGEQHRFAGVETQVDIRVSHRWKRGKVTAHVAGMPRFPRGEDVILFLEPVERGVIPTGLYQGVFRVERRPEGTVVSQIQGRVHYVEREMTEPHGETRQVEDTLGIPVKQFRKEIELYTPDDARPYRRIEERGPAVLQ